MQSGDCVQLVLTGYSTKRFLERAPLLINKMNDAARDVDEVIMKRSAHELKSAAGQLGAGVISYISASIQDDSKKAIIKWKEIRNKMNDSLAIVSNELSNALAD